MYSGVGVTLPSLGLELATSGVGLGLIETVYLAAGAAFLLPLGCIAQHSDKRTLFSVGLLVYACATLTIGWLPSTGSIVAVRVIQGIASAFMGATVMAILFERHRRGCGAGQSGSAWARSIAGWRRDRWSPASLRLSSGGAGFSSLLPFRCSRPFWLSNRHATVAGCSRNRSSTGCPPFWSS